MARFVASAPYFKATISCSRTGRPLRSMARRLTSESYADRPTWSPAPYNEIAFAVRTSSRFDIKIYQVDKGVTRQITFGEGTNESPAWAPNGKHLAFMSSRSGRGNQIYVVRRDGKDVRQVTREGNNFQPHWSH